MSDSEPRIVSVAERKGAIMPILKNAPGRTTDLECGYFRSVTGAMKIIRSGKAAIAAGDDGALYVYRDDRRSLRVGFYRRKNALDERTLKSAKELREWLNNWRPRLYEFHGGAE